MTGEYSKHSISRFVQCVPAILDDLQSIVNGNINFTDSAIKLSKSIPSTTQKFEAEQGDDTQDGLLSSCKQNFVTTQAAIQAFIDVTTKRFLLVEVDHAYVIQLKTTVGQGDYTLFSSYIEQFKLYLDQCSTSCQELVRACVDAEAQCESAPLVREVSYKHQQSLDAATIAMKNKPKQFDNKLFFGACITGGLAATLMATNSLSVHTGIFLCLCLMAVIIIHSLVEKPLAIRSTKGRHKKIERRAFVRIENTENIFSDINRAYSDLRQSASDIDSGLINIKDTLESLLVTEGSLFFVKEEVEHMLFCSELDAFLQSVKKAHETLKNSCFEKFKEVTQD